MAGNLNAYRQMYCICRGLHSCLRRGDCHISGVINPQLLMPLTPAYLNVMLDQTVIFLISEVDHYLLRVDCSPVLRMSPGSKKVSRFSEQFDPLER